MKETNQCGVLHPKLGMLSKHSEEKCMWSVFRSRRWYVIHWKENRFLTQYNLCNLLSQDVVTEDSASGFRKE